MALCDSRSSRSGLRSDKIINAEARTSLPALKAGRWLKGPCPPQPPPARHSAAAS
ncbi:hypothetical protein B0T14DRAFT_503030 [Immersiella caudata]|uniref:Uncharacterized protein n=1 Tax=Immersiella caudata TaxID=314043 RepID=A0AA39XF23_9PEZI|nr:hypothetical protein B0T14DRAFT_503030 [Immersiella caudata]